MTRAEFLKNALAVGAVAAAGTSFLRPVEAGGEWLRPPGAIPEDEFRSRCIRCSRCVEACPNGCILSFTDGAGEPFSARPGRGAEGTPVIFPRRQACMLCQGSAGDELRCGAACPTGALLRIPKTPEAIQARVDMGRAEVDARLCYSYNNASCGVCVRACPFGGRALKAGILETPRVDPDWCVGCGLCERACIRYPQAIFVRSGRRA
jgi:MauM/NapG family ferredoxin protein